MSTNRILKLESAGSEQTEQIAEKLAVNLKGGSVLELISDLGGGKTTFVRGLARGLGSPDHVTSPTFKLSNLYNVPEQKNSEWDDIHRIYHYDFYRLADSGLMGNELHESLSDPNGLVVVEWGKVVARVLPKDRISITFVQTSDHRRHLVVDCPIGLKFVLEGLI